MKKGLKWIALTPVFLIGGILTIILTFYIVIPFLFNLPYEVHELFYYRNLKNYHTVDAVVDTMEYNDDTNQLYLDLFIDAGRPFESHWQYTLFPESADTAIQAGILKDVHPGDTVTITVAPSVIGDGYRIPIAAISHDGKNYLTFDVGWENILRDHFFKN